MSDVPPTRFPDDPTGETVVSGPGLDTQPMLKATRDLLAHWRARHGPTGVPARRSFDVVDLGPWLGDLAVWDYMGDRDDYLCRLFGSRSVERLGIEMTNGWLRDYPAGLGPRLRRHYDGARLGAAPLLVLIPRPILPNPRDPRERFRAEKLVLPLSRSGEAVDCLMSYLVFVPLPEAD